MKVLTVDIGNTRTKYHYFENDTLQSFGILEKHQDLQQLVNKIDPDKVGISSVNPVKSDSFLEQIPSQYIHKLVKISAASKLNFQLDYETPETLGSDRICSMAGAIHLSPKTDLLFVIDSGTCITVNTIVNGVFTGGLIAPGIDTMLKSLRDYTGALPLLEKYVPEELDGKNTADSMMTGVLMYLSGLKNYMKSTTKILKTEPKVFITGGNGIYLHHQLEVKSHYDEHLVALGIKNLVYLNS